MKADATTTPPTAAPPTTPFQDYVALAKVRITMMVVLTTAVGFIMASTGPLPWLLFLHTLIGTALVSSGASTLNQVIEIDRDARMRRTARRPLAAGRLRRGQGLVFGVALAVIGMVYLALLVNLLTAVLGALTLAAYVFVYTPMKRYSSLSTIVGAVPGAVPPMMGVTAATDQVGLLAWVLFGLLFLWQMPHFLAIAWLYRSDYERGGFPMLSVIDIGGATTARQMALWAAVLIPVSLLPTVLGFAGPIYFVGALVTGLIFFGYSLAFGRSHSLGAARRVLLVSVMYLPAVLGLLLVDQGLLR